jgi:hypothetical protein
MLMARYLYRRVLLRVITEGMLLLVALHMVINYEHVYIFLFKQHFVEIITNIVTVRNFDTMSEKFR